MPPIPAMPANFRLRRYLKGGALVATRNRLSNLEKWKGCPLFLLFKIEIMIKHTLEGVVVSPSAAVQFYRTHRSSGAAAQ